MSIYTIERDIEIEAPVHVVWRTITEPEQIRPAVERAIKVIKEEKRPALVDVYMQMV